MVSGRPHVKIIKKYSDPWTGKAYAKCINIIFGPANTKWSTGSVVV